MEGIPRNSKLEVENNCERLKEAVIFIKVLMVAIDP